MTHRHSWFVVGALVHACGGGHASVPTDVATDVATDTVAPIADAGGSAGTVGHYEAEDGALAGGATIVGSGDASDRTIGDLGGEASGRQAVTLAAPGDAVAFALEPADTGANAVVIRFSMPDAPGGGGVTAPLALTATAPGFTTLSRTFTLTSRYAWLYGSGPAGTKLYNSPTNAAMFAKSTVPTHLYDEAQLMLGQPLPAGATITLALPAGAAAPVTVDFLEVEVVAPPATAPPGFVSITDPSCGAIALDTHATGQAYDGIDDAAYASVFDIAIGSNPFNPTDPDGVQPAGTQEKDYYASGSDDALQDEVATAASAGLGMFALADHNLQSLEACVAQTTAGGGSAAGVWIPPGRFYVRGTLALPSNAVLRGAGMWYAKLVAVDTAAPVPVTNPATGGSGIASTSGDVRIVPMGGAATGVAATDFAMFGNATQRDVVDEVAPHGVIGAFTSSTFARLWFEHMSQGIVIDGSAAGDTLDGLRSRDTFADGIDLFGVASTTTISNSQSRNNGDDGFAIWSQGSASVSAGNVLIQSQASLEWFGDGLAVYGGTDVTLTSNTATDVLTGAGLKLATEFVPTDLPATFTMTGIQVGQVTLVRCGGIQFGQANGAVLIGAQDEAIAGMTLDQLQIVDPTEDAIDFRLLSSVGAVASPGAVDGVTITNTQVVGATTCGSVGSGVHGDATLTDVCACTSVGAAAAPCAVDDEVGSAFVVAAATCAAATCTAP